MGIFADFAEHYWNAGLPVIPLAVKDKLPVTKGWQALQSRMPTYEERESWKDNFANGNIGLPLGPESGLIAMDIDTDDPAVLGVLQKILPPSPWERVGAKGKVWIYKFDGQPTFRVKHKTPEGLKGLIDMQSLGTQIVVPPSIHPKTGQPYWQNVDLTTVLDKVVSLPPNVADIIRDALKEIGIDASTGSGGVGALTDFVSLGNRDNRLVSIAGMCSRDIIKGEITLKEGMGRMTAWAEDFTKKVHGDSIDPKKGIQKLVEFLTRDVKGKGKALPKGWDEGLSDEEKTKLDLGYFGEDDERWSYEQILNEFNSQLERTGVHDNEGEFMAIANRAIQRIASNTELGSLEEDRLVRFIASISGDKLTVGGVRNRLKELKRGSIMGADHREVADAARRDLEELGGQIRYDQGKLWQWRGDHWTAMDDNEVLKHIAAEYGHLPAAKRSSDHGGILRTLKLACYDELTKNKVEGINFVNGFLTEDLELKPHDPNFGMTYVLPYPYAPDAAAKCQRWLEMLSHYWGDDDDYADKVEALREAICVTLFGKAPSAQLAFVLYGIAHSGKSRILEIIRALMPPECTTSLPPQIWGEKFAPAQLAGKLLNVAGELSEHQNIDAAKFKEIVDGQEIKGEHKNQALFMFRPTAAHWFATNHLPKTKDSSEGFTRRFLFLKFNKKFPEDKSQRDYDRIVVAEEREAIAAWAVQGMRTLKANNGKVTDPPSSRKERAYLEGQLNSVRSFLTDFQEQGRLLLGVERTQEATTFDTLWTEYRSYCAISGVSPVGSKALGKRLEHLQGVFGYRVEAVTMNSGFLTNQYRFLTLVRSRAA